MSSLPGVAVTFRFFWSLELKWVAFIFLSMLASSFLHLFSRCQGCEVVLSGIEEQVSRANQHKEQQLALKQQIESEVSGPRREQPKPLTLK